MKSYPEFDAVIIGAGIAGLSTADALIQKGFHCAIIDQNSPGSGASGAPRMLVNPATGRRAKMSMGSEEAVALVHDLLERVQKESEEKFYEQNGVIRPALYPEIGEDFKRSPQKYNWPDGWINWFDENEFRAKFPFFETQFGGLVIEHALTVEGSIYIRNLSNYLTQKGLRTFYNIDSSYKKSGENWIVTLDDDEKISTKNIICATGSYLAEESHWRYLGLHLIKGQTATFYFDEDLPLSHSVSSLGYMAFMNHSPKKLVVGSTYEHHYDYPEPDLKGLNYLKEKLDNTLTRWSSKIIRSEQWSGFRVTSKDKKPIIGEHPEHTGLYIIGALGSKGMLLGRYISEQLADLIIKNKTVDDALSIRRFF